MKIITIALLLFSIVALFSQNLKAEEGNEKTRDEVKIEGDLDLGISSGAYWLNGVLMPASASATIQIPFSCPNLLSSYIVSGGSAVYLLKEIYHNLSFQGDLKALPDKINEGTKEEQLAAAEAGKEHAELLVQRLSARIHSLLFTNVFYSAATAISLAEIYFQPSPCVAAEKKAETPKQEELDSRLDPPADKFDGLEHFKSPPAVEQTIETMVASRNNFNDKEQEYRLSNVLINALMPMAHASLLKSNLGENLGFVGVGAGAFLAAKFAAGPMIKAGVSNPAIRSSVYGALTILSVALTFQNESARTQAQERVDEYTRIIERINASNAVPLGDSSIEVDTDNTIITRNNSEGNNGSNACAVSSTSKLEISTDCSCQKSNSCSTFPSTEEMIKQKGLSFPTALKDNLSFLEKTYNASASGKNTASSDLSESSLRSRAARQKKITDGIKKKINSELKKQGYKPFPFEKLSRKLASGIMNKIGNELKSKGINSLFGPASLSPKKESKKKVEKGKSSASTHTVGGPQASKTKSSPNFSFSDSNGTNNSNELDTAKELESYKFTANDIVQKEETSLFKVLSSRYLQEYDKLFKAK